MAELEPLISTRDLKTSYLKNLRSARVYVKCDALFDALMILFVPPEIETVVHYIDDHVALLYKPDDKEVVGLQVEAFERRFLPQHASVLTAWRLSDACEELKDVGDIILAAEAAKPKVAREVVTATRDVLGPAGQRLVEAVEHVYA